MSKSKRVDPTKVGKPQSRHAIRSGYEYKPSLHDKRRYEEQAEHHRQAKLWYKQGQQDRAQGTETEFIPTEYRKHYDMGFASASVACSGDDTKCRKSSGGSRSG